MTQVVVRNLCEGDRLLDEGDIAEPAVPVLGLRPRRSRGMSGSARKSEKSLAPAAKARTFCLGRADRGRAPQRSTLAALPFVITPSGRNVPPS